MKKYSEQKCRKRMENFEPEQFFKENGYESRKLKNLLRRAVEKELAPQGLIDSISREIRREI